MGDRAVTPVVGKALEIAVVVLYIALLTASLYGNAVPEYRSEAAGEIGDRTLSTAAHRVQQAVPSTGTVNAARVRVDLPDRIRGETYRIQTDGAALVLDHPHPDVGGRARLSLSERVDAVEGVWRSEASAAVVVKRVNDGYVVRLEEDG